MSQTETDHPKVVQQLEELHKEQEHQKNHVSQEKNHAAQQEKNHVKEHKNNHKEHDKHHNNNTIKKHHHKSKIHSGREQQLVGGRYITICYITIYLIICN